MRLRVVTITFLLALAGPARADLSYTFLDLGGIYQSSLIDVELPTAPGSASLAAGRPVGTRRIRGRW